MKEKRLAACLSFLFVGAGQVYNGEIAKAIAMFFGAVVLSILTFGIGGIAFWIWSIVDAYQRAR